LTTRDRIVECALPMATGYPSAHRRAFSICRFKSLARSSTPAARRRAPSASQAQSGSVVAPCSKGGAMRRRQFITLLGGAAASWPLAARPQQGKMPVVGFLNAGSPDGYTPYVTGFLRGLAKAGYVEGKNVAVDYRWARGQYDHLQTMAAGLVRLNVAVVVANTPAAPVAKASTMEIPIVFVSTGDPVICRPCR
jgi:ABC transporter substrate binding protein